MSTKEHIIQTSLLLFLQKSYRDVTMSEIVQKTGLSKGAFYHHFKSKEELFKEITLNFFKMGALDYSGLPKNSLKEFYNAYINHLVKSFEQLALIVPEDEQENVNFNFFLILFEAVSRFPEFLQLELTQHKKDVKAWKNVIAKAKLKGEIKSEASDKKIANMFLYQTDGVFLRYVNSDKVQSFKTYLQNAFDTIYINLKV